MTIGREGTPPRHVHGRRVQGRGGHGRRGHADGQARAWGIRGRRLCAARQTWGRGGHDYRSTGIERLREPQGKKTVKEKERADKEEGKYERQKKKKWVI